MGTKTSELCKGGCRVGSGPTSFLVDDADIIESQKGRIFPISVEEQK